MLSYDHLLEYTGCQRESCQEWFMRQGGSALAGSTDPHADGRFDTIEQVVRHIFSAEKRYVERMNDRPLTDTSVIPTDDIDAPT
jgi:hypothetical protein